MEINVLAGHIDHDGGVIGDTDEFKIDATIAGGGKLLTGKREHLRGRFTVAGEGDELLIIRYVLIIDGSEVFVVYEFEANRIRRVIVLIPNGNIFRRWFGSIDSTRVLQFGQRCGKLGFEVGLRIVSCNQCHSHSVTAVAH